MRTSSTERPWYCRDDAVEEYKTTLTDDGEALPMLKQLKIIRSIIVNLGIIGISLYGVYSGGEPTVIAISALLVLGAYNGLEYSDYAALLQAYREVQAETTPDDSTED